LAPLLLVLLIACTSSNAATPSRRVVTEIAGTFPRLSGTALDGTTVSPPDFAGRVVVLNFWATWCAPCKREQPILSKVEREQGANGAVFLGVSYRDGEGAARAYARAFDVPYPSMSDPTGSIAYRFGVPYLPATVIADAAGRLRYRIVGALDEATLTRLLDTVSDSS
jgi:thiol-disulfide isomerase/thioredoxin